MRPVEIVIRQIGVAHVGLNVQTKEAVLDHLEKEYLSKGYGLQATHYMGDVLNEQKGIQGYRVMFVLVLAGMNAEVTKALPEVAEEPKKRGRPAKVEA